MEYISKSLKDTEEIAANILAALKGGEVLALQGELGAGKTALTQALALELGVTDNVNSPTFVIMKVYDTQNEKIKKLIHIDAYRVKSEKELITIGAPEYFDTPGTLTVIEWPENIKKILPKSSIQIQITNKGKEARVIKIQI